MNKTPEVYGYAVMADKKIRTSDGDLTLADMRSCNYYKPHPHERTN